MTINLDFLLDERFAKTYDAVKIFHETLDPDMLEMFGESDKVVDSDFLWDNGVLYGHARQILYQGNAFIFIMDDANLSDHMGYFSTLPNDLGNLFALRKNKSIDLYSLNLSVDINCQWENLLLRAENSLSSQKGVPIRAFFHLRNINTKFTEDDSEEVLQFSTNADSEKLARHNIDLVRLPTINLYGGDMQPRYAEVLEDLQFHMDKYL